jgi:PAS domain S-box-containing protein
MINRLKEIHFFKAAHFNSPLALAGFALFMISGLFALPKANAFQLSTAITPVIIPQDTLIVGSEAIYAPFCFVNEQNQVDGYANELFRAAAEAAGLQVKFVTGEWEDLMRNLQNGKIDALPFVVRTTQREHVVDFSLPYLSLYASLMIRDQDSAISSMKHLEGKKIGVMKGGFVENFLKETGHKSLVIRYTTIEQALISLSKGECDAMITQKLVAFSMMHKLGLSGIRSVTVPIDALLQNFCFAVAEGNTTLLNSLNEGIAIINANGKYREISEKWMAPKGDFDNSKSRILIAGDLNYPPFEYLDENGQPAGFNVDIVNAIARELGLVLEIRLDHWAAVRRDLEHGQIDAIAGMFYTSERDKILDFSPPHSMVSEVFIYRKSDPEPQSISDLQDKSVIVEEGDIMHDLILKNGNAQKLITTRTQVEALQLLAAGKGDCSLMSRTQALYLIERENLKNLKISDKPIFLAEYCFAVNGGNHRILNLLNEGLTSIKSSGEYRKIYTKWLGKYDDHSSLSKRFIRYLGLILILLLVLLVAVTAWSRMLRRTVEKRTISLRESEATLRQLTENSRQVYWLSDWVTKKLLYLSPAFETLYGISVEKVYADRSCWKKPIHPDDRDRVDLMDKISEQQGAPVEAEYRIIDPDGQIRWVYDRSYPIFNEKGELYRYVSIAEDITPRKLTEIELHQTNIQLIRAKQKAEESDRLKSSFLANMSHEIRTPMNGILGFAELLEDPHLNDAEQKKYLGIIQQSGERMLALINDLIDISKIESGQITISPQEFDPHLMLKDLYAFFLPEAQKKGLVLVLESAANHEKKLLFSDKAKINQILVNLIKNAIKFTFKGSVSFGYENLPTGMEFFITDTGIGISRENQMKIFERFSRDHAAPIREIEGAGLGLSISKAYVELLGGFIRVDSNPGNGSTFSFTLPYEYENKNQES